MNGRSYWTVNSAHGLWQLTADSRCPSASRRDAHPRPQRRASGHIRNIGERDLLLPLWLRGRDLRRGRKKLSFIALVQAMLPLSLSHQS
ncbi:hypothetical protein BDV26DRAFT_272786 [Aspergillus bertholletiae]|uniref:Uncharacterized protein n=1 Tax=Aspergillus bertholletiae TaxID=1226010 RepID=A0A5N7AVQ4_9EURO|nr:hypothetical protein BDV26DRAFT_272786 [Aspergillus bertholletiae]